MLALVFLLLIGVPLGSARAGNRWTVEIRPQVQARHAAPVLADIATLAGPDPEILEKLARISLGPVPDARSFSRAEILSLVRKLIPAADQVEIAGADFTRVILEQRKADAAEIEGVLKDYLASVTCWQREEIEIRAIKNLAELSLPAGVIQMRVSSRGVPANFRNMLVSVELSLDDTPIRNIWVKADVRVRAHVVEAARMIPFRSSLTVGDVREVDREIDDPHFACVRSAADAVGMVVKRALAEGELITQRALEAASLVRSGDMVRLVARINGIQVSTLVRALQNGKLGDRIKVRNMDSDRALVAVVTGKGAVEIAQ